MHDQDLDHAVRNEAPGDLSLRPVRSDDGRASDDARAAEADSSGGADPARLRGVPGPLATHPRARSAGRGAAQPRVVAFTPLPKPFVDRFDPEDILEVLIETIEEELTVEERDACTYLPIGQDPVYWLIRKHFADEMTLDQIGRIWGVTRERVRQIEGKALARKAMTVGLRSEAPDDVEPRENSATRRENMRARIQDLLEDGLTNRAIVERLGTNTQLVSDVRREMARGAA